MAETSEREDKARRFLELHRPGQPLLMPNAWDSGSARVLAGLGFEALATTSSGHAATLGLRDGSVTRDQALGHAAELVRAAGTLPVSADLENGFADEPDGVAETVRLAAEAGLAGCSIEDFTGDPQDPIYQPGLAGERIAAAAAAANQNGGRVALTARCENLLHGRYDLADTVARLLAYQDAGADVLYAPGLRDSAQIRQVLDAVDLPLNVLARPGLPSVAELGELGVSRISVGGAFAFAALGALVEAGNELREEGTYRFLERARLGVTAATAAFEPRA